MRFGEALCLVADVEARITLAVSRRLESQSAQHMGQGQTGASAGDVSVQSSGKLALVYKRNDGKPGKSLTQVCTPPKVR